MTFEGREMAVRRIVLNSLILPVLLVWLHSCAHYESNNTSNTSKEVFEFEMSGDTRGNCKMILEKTMAEGDAVRVAGTFSGMVYDYVGGPGELDCKFEGKLYRDNIDCQFSGWGDMEEIVFLKGKFSGTLGDTGGAGEWEATHTRGSSAGTWKIKKTSHPH